MTERHFSSGRRRLAALLAPLTLAAAGCGPALRGDGPPPSEPDLSQVEEPTPRPEAYSRGGNPPFYEVFGKRYYVLPTHEGYKEEGVASWYGAKFHGRKTSNGEVFDMYAISAAHKTLPLPTFARVTNLRNGTSIVVRINDRGPFVNNRLIDLSYAAALKLDMVRDGTTLVSVEAISPESLIEAPPIAPVLEPAAPATTAAAPAAATTRSAVYVQVGAFAEADNAQRLAARLTRNGVENVFVREDPRDGLAVYRVRFGPVESIEAYDRTIALLDSLGIEDTHLATDQDTALQ
ncbi:MAG: septal ring lytic transglycosylase RlpA family protein [Pseudomonadota bacterium]